MWKSKHPRLITLSLETEGWEVRPLKGTGPSGKGSQARHWHFPYRSRNVFPKFQDLQSGMSRKEVIFSLIENSVRKDGSSSRNGTLWIWKQLPQTHRLLVCLARLERVPLISSGEASRDWSCVKWSFWLCFMSISNKKKHFIHVATDQSDGGNSSQLKLSLARVTLGLCQDNWSLLWQIVKETAGRDN